ncbi:MAG: hypothetical protein IKL08_05080 [Clostridia bacterium]|nr:hypothetical protein [Clostridia bacterium]
MSKVIVYFVPDVQEIFVRLICEYTLEECFEKISIFCEKYKDSLYKSKISVYSENKKLMFSFQGTTPEYNIEDSYKELESNILEIYNKYYLNCHSVKKTISVDELKNMNVRIRGYAMPDDNAPDFYEKCKVSEVLVKLRESIRDFPEISRTHCFYVSSEDGVDLFSIDRELDFETICLARINEFNLTKEMVKEALGVE